MSRPTVNQSARLVLVAGVRVGVCPPSPEGGSVGRSGAAADPEMLPRPPTEEKNGDNEALIRTGPHRTGPGRVVQGSLSELNPHWLFVLYGEQT